LRGVARAVYPDTCLGGLEDFMVQDGVRTTRTFIAAVAAIPLTSVRLAADSQPPREVPTLRATSGDRRVTVEIHGHGLIHFEFASKTEPKHRWIPTTPMVLPRDHTGRKRLVHSDTLDTPTLRLRIDPATLCLDVTDRTREPPTRVTTLC